VSVIAVVGSVLTVLPAILRKKPFCLWYWNGTAWVLKAGPFSYRQCRKTRTALTKLGMTNKFTILRKGVEPPK
jgi:hypothetical protein